MITGIDKSSGPSVFLSGLSGTTLAGRISGVASDVMLTISVGDQVVGVVRGNLTDPSQDQAGPVSRGFEVDVPQSLFDDKDHEIKVYVSGTTNPLTVTPRALRFGSTVKSGGIAEPSPKALPELAVVAPQAEVASADPRCPAQFDPDFYLLHNVDVKDAGIDAWEHYSQQGWRELRSPCATFSTFAYFADDPSRISSGEIPFLQWVSEGAVAIAKVERRTAILSSFLTDADVNSIRSLVDPLYTLFSNHQCTPGCEEEFVLSSPYAGTRFNPLFDGEYYAQQAKIKGSANFLRRHYLSEGWKSGLSPHPLFDAGYYESQLGAELDQPALVHFLETGWKANLSPHPLFDVKHYASRAGINERICPLLHYMLLATADAEPHFLFSDSWFGRAVGEAIVESETGLSPLQLYLTHREFQTLTTHLYFDPRHYSREIERLASGPLKSELQQNSHGMSPLEHYIQHGSRVGLAPCAHFWPEFYALQVSKAQPSTRIKPSGAGYLRHYLTDGGRKQFSPNPVLDPRFMSENIPDYDVERHEPLTFIMSKQPGDRPNTSRLFDPAAYFDHYHDVSEKELCPIEHFILYGMYEERKPRQFYSIDYARRAWGHSVKRTILENYLFDQATTQKTRLLFTSHDATRTGAPGIVLRLIKDFSKLPGVECYCILDRGGELLPEFESFAHTYVLERSVYEIGTDNEVHRQEISKILRGISIDYAICNSIETRHISQYLNELRIPTIMLMHEVPDYYPKSELEFTLRQLSHIIFPSNYVKNKMAKKVDLDDRFFSVIGQGLLNEEFLHWSRDRARAEVLKELSLPASAFVVLGCGTVDFRKGVDHFVAAAVQVIPKSMKDDKDPIYFVWFGQGDYGHGTPVGFVLDQLRQQGIEDRVRFVGQRANMPKYMASCDVFFMSSRADPFPCVVHEAMASGLPVVHFREGGGAGELVQGDGIAVDMGDVAAAGAAILSYHQDRARRDRTGRSARTRIGAEWKSPDYAAKIAQVLANTFGATEDLAKIRHALSSRDHAMPPHALVDHAVSSAPASNLRSPIYFLSPDWTVSGVNSYTSNLIKGLRQLGWDARLLFTRGNFTAFNEDLNGQPILPDVPWSFCYPERKDVASICKALQTFLADAPPCIVVPNYDYVGSSIAPVTSPKVRWAGVAHSDHIEHYEHVYRLGHYWDAIVPVSGRVRDGIVALNATFGDKVHLIYCGVPAYDGPRIVRDAEKIRLVYAGRMVTEQKQVQRYLQLATSLNEAGIPFELHLVGDGERLADLRNSSAHLASVKIHGRCSREETLAIMATCDVFVLLSDYEGLPMALVEAMSVGLVPVVYPIRSGIGEVVTPGQNGFISSSPSIATVTHIIRQLHSNRRQLEAVSEAARATIGNLGLSVEHMARAYSELFENVLRKAQTDNGSERVPSFAWRSLDGSLPPVNVESFL